MKRTPFISKWAILLLIGLVGSLFAAGRPDAAGNAAKMIRIGGTGTALATMRLLGIAFEKKHPGITVKVYPSLGSSGGIKALLGGGIDVAVASKMPSAEQREMGLIALEYGKTPFVFVTQPMNPVTDITLVQAKDIYAGMMTEWPNGTPIRLVTRPVGESSTLLLKEISPEMSKAVESSLVRPGLALAVTDQENADMIEKLPGSFGAASLSQLIAEKRAIKVLSLDGIQPTPEALEKGDYPFFKDLYLVTGPRSSKAAGLFVDFVFSPQGRTLLTGTGHLVMKRRN